MKVSYQLEYRVPPVDSASLWLLWSWTNI